MSELIIAQIENHIIQAAKLATNKLTPKEGVFQIDEAIKHLQKMRKPIFDKYIDDEATADVFSIE